MDKTKVFEAAGKFAAKGQFDKAGKEYQRILDEDPKDVRALQKLAEIYQKANKIKEATDLMLRVAEGYTEQGFFLKAVAVYKQVLKVGPERIEVNQRLAQLYQQLGLIGDATQQWQLVANHFDRQGNMKESLAAVRKMVELDPDNVASQVKLAELYARENMVKEATAEFRKAAAYLRRNSRMEDYVRVLERIGQLAGDDPVTAKELAKQYLAQGDTKRALAKLQICFRSDPKDVDTLQLLAQAFSALGQDAKTISVFRELASIYNIRNDTEAEKGCLSRILELAPDDEEAATRMREISGRPAPKREPERERTLSPSGRGPIIPPAPPPPASRVITPPPPPPAPMASASRAPRALDSRLAPTIAKIITETDVYLKYGLLPKAAEHIRKALIDDPTCIPAHEKLLAIVDRQGRADEVLHQLERLVELSRESGDVERDRKFTQELAQKNPDHPLVLAAAARAELPPVDDEDLVIDPDASIAPEAIHVPIESTFPPGYLDAGETAEAEPLSDDEDVVVDPEPLSIAPPPRPRLGAPITAPPPASQGVRTGTTLSFHLPEEQIQEISGEPAASEELIDAPEDESADLALQAAFESSIRPRVSYPPPDFDDEAQSPEPALQAPEEDDPFAGPPPRTGPLEREEVEEEPVAGDPATDYRQAPVDPFADESPAQAAEASADEEEPWPAAEPLAPPPAETPEDQAEEEPHHELAAPSEELAPASEHAPQVDPDLYQEEYEEAEFLMSQGLTDDARRALEDILEKAPGHPGATALLEQLTGPSHDEPVPEGPSSLVDLGAELQEELAGVNLGMPVPTPVADPHSVSDMLSEFKKALSTTVSAEDSQTHYDLGIAYKEMGLLDEAIHEFEIASQSSGRRHLLDCLTMLGMCHLEKGRPHQALDFFTQALQAPGLTLEASKEAHFQMGVCHEQMEELREAMEHYARVYKADPEYRDVKPRLARLSRLAHSGAPRNGVNPPGGPSLPEAPAGDAARAGRGKIGYI